MVDQADCVEVRELLPELAAGVASGDDRARALRHLSGCAACRRELDALAVVVDELLTLVPPVEPPAGFESSVLARIEPAKPRWLRRRVRRGTVLRLAATVVLAAAAGVGVTMQATADDRQLADSYRRTLQVADGRYLTARLCMAPGGIRAGRVFAYQGRPSWVFVVVDYASAAERYQVHLTTRDGRDRLLGEVPVKAGKGSWGIAIDVDVDQIAEVRLAGTDPPLTARFATR